MTPSKKEGGLAKTSRAEVRVGDLQEEGVGLFPIFLVSSWSSILERIFSGEGKASDPILTKEEIEESLKSKMPLLLFALIVALCSLYLLGSWLLGFQVDVIIIPAIIGVGASVALSFIESREHIKVYLEDLVENMRRKKEQSLLPHEVFRELVDWRRGEDEIEVEGKWQNARLIYQSLDTGGSLILRCTGPKEEGSASEKTSSEKTSIEDRSIKDRSLGEEEMEVERGDLVEVILWEDFQRISNLSLKRRKEEKAREKERQKREWRRKVDDMKKNLRQERMKERVENSLYTENLEAISAARRAEQEKEEDFSEIRLQALREMEEEKQAEAFEQNAVEEALPSGLDSGGVSEEEEQRT